MWTMGWTYATYEEIAAVLGDTDNGLKGSEIGNLLHQLNMADPQPKASKHDRLTAAFVERHNRDSGDAKRIVTFITHAMEPIRYRDRPDLFALRQDRLNERLAFVGLHVNDEGKMQRGAVARTLDEASRIATSIRDELARRVRVAEAAYTRMLVSKKLLPGAAAVMASRCSVGSSRISTW